MRVILHRPVQPILVLLLGAMLFWWSAAWESYGERFMNYSDAARGGSGNRKAVGLGGPDSTPHIDLFSNGHKSAFAVQQSSRMTGLRLAAFPLGAHMFVAGTGWQSLTAGYGQTQWTERVSVASGNREGNSDSGTIRMAGTTMWVGGGVLSADGRYVAFHSRAYNLAADDRNQQPDVFLHDRQTGETVLVSRSSSGEPGNSDSEMPSISADGRFIAFQSSSHNLVEGDTNGMDDVFVRDLLTGQTERVSVATDGKQAGVDCRRPCISADGFCVAFLSRDNTLVSGDRNWWTVLDVFVRDRRKGTTELVSVSTTGEQANDDCADPALSADGRFVAFASEASTLVADDTNGVSDIFVHDRLTGRTERVSVSSSREEANGASSSPSISADGRFIAFLSWASNLVPGDTNGLPDVFVYDRQLKRTELVSVSTTGEHADRNSGLCSISGDGRFVVFDSRATNLVPGDTNGTWDIFVHDRLTHRTQRLSISSTGQEGNGESWCPSISADGRFVCFASIASNLVPDDTNLCWDVFVSNRLAWSPGDFDNDGAITSADLVAFVAAWMAYQSGQADWNRLADVDMDGKLTARDAQVMLEALLGAPGR